MERLRRVLIANRGEIACRIARTCRRLGIATVGVYSEADAASPHVRAVDEAVCIGPAPASDSYLDVDRIVDVALRRDADAIHPGYGFLAENPALADACAAKGLVFVGPSAEVIRLMGDKLAAKRAAADAGVPVVPGPLDPLDDDGLRAAAAELGFPVLIKPVAGGGGKGMYVVREPRELDERLAAARRVAAAAFGDDRLMLERLLDDPRHIEVQVIADRHGQVRHLLERECSVQRRHQKIIEECPAVDPELRAELGAAAVRLAAAVGYENAGTVEFILDRDGAFYMIEMNTRLQVEHPVTEAVLGVDLVELQLRVAAGEPLPATLEELEPSGHAIEARIYAEDPAADFLPQAGTVRLFRPPTGVRVDSGVETGTPVPRYYDPMLAKVVAHGDDRADALRRLRRALDELVLLGITTNLTFLRTLLDHPDVVAGRATTGLADELAAGWRPPPPPPAVIAALAAATVHRVGGPWGGRGPWRLGGVGGWPLLLGDRRVEVVATRRGLRLRTEDATFEVEVVAVATNGAATDLELGVDGVRHRAVVVLEERCGWVATGGWQGAVPLLPATRRAATGVPTAGAAVAPMPGTVTSVEVAPGEQVDAGRTLVVIEAMKMEHPVRAPSAGVVRAVHVRPGDTVEAGAVLVDLGAAEEAR